MIIEISISAPIWIWIVCLAILIGIIVWGALKK